MSTWSSCRGQDADAGSRGPAGVRNPAKFDGTLMLNGGYDEQSGKAAIEEGVADLISFGAPFLAHPYLPERFRTHTFLNHEDPATFYAGE